MARWREDIVILILLLAVFPCSPLPAAPASKLRRTDLASMMTEDYVVVGRKPDSNATYTGRLNLRARGSKLAFTRMIEGRTVRGTATLEMTVVGDPAPVLRMRFVQDGQRLEATFQWMFDLDNYARFTGYVYRADASTAKAAGLEMLFPLPPSVRE